MKLFPFRTDFHNHVSIRASTRQARSSEYPDVAIGLVLALLIAQLIKNLPTVQKPWVQSLCWEDPLEKEMATHSSILAWEVPWMEEPGSLQSMGSQRVGHD